MENKKEKTNSKLTKLGFFLNRNLGIHIVLTMLLNVLVGIGLVGLFEAMNYSIFNFTIAGFIIYMIVFSLLETMIIIFVLRFYMKLILVTKGLIVPLFYGLLFYLSSIIIKDVAFKSPVIIKIIIFVISFLILKLLMIVVFQRLQKKENYHGKNDL